MASLDKSLRHSGARQGAIAARAQIVTMTCQAAALVRAALLAYVRGLPPGLQPQAQPQVQRPSCRHQHSVRIKKQMPSFSPLRILVLPT